MHFKIQKLRNVVVVDEEDIFSVNVAVTEYFLDSLIIYHFACNICSTQRIEQQQQQQTMIKKSQYA